jgi:hypothetical protein
MLLSSVATSDMVIMAFKATMTNVTAWIPNEMKSCSSLHAIHTTSNGVARYDSAY